MAALHGINASSTIILIDLCLRCTMYNVHFDFDCNALMFFDLHLSLGVYAYRKSAVLKFVSSSEIFLCYIN